MSKKIIVSLIVIFVFIVSVGGFYAYKKGYFKCLQPSSPPDILKPENLLTFTIKDNNLPLAAKEIFENKFTETKETLQKNLDDFDSWLYLGVLKKGVGDYAGARDVFIYVGQIRPKNSSSFSNLADLYANFLNESLKAEEAIKTAIANSPDDYNFYMTLAEIYRYKIPGKEALYEQTLLDALQKFPDNVNLISPLALYYRQTDQVQKAIIYYEKLVKLNPENLTAQQDLAELKQIKN